jgi:hypothetical protein
MKTLAIALALAFFVSTEAFAQSADQKTALDHRGKVKMWLGAGLVGAGVFVMPVTAAGGQNGPIGEGARAAGVGLIAAGGTLIYLGGVDRHKANAPSTTIGVAVGKVTAIRFRRRW